MKIIKILAALTLLLTIQPLFALDSSDPTLIFPATVNPTQPTEAWGKINRKYPTNAWFINFLNSTSELSDSVNVLPYLARADVQGLKLSYTHPNYFTEPLYKETVAGIYYQFDHPISIEASERLQERTIDAYGKAHVTLQWRNHLDGKMTAPLCLGSPYVTVYYQHLTPQIAFSTTIVKVNQLGRPARFGKINKYVVVVRTSNHQTQTWIVYAEHPIKLEWKTDHSGRSVLLADVKYEGWIRLVLSSDDKTATQINEQTLDAYKNTIPLQLNENVESTSADTIALRWSWKTSDNRTPLMLTLPHQRKLLEQRSTLLNDVVYHGIKGDMIGIADQDQRFLLHVPTVAFAEPQQHSASKKDDIHTALVEESNQVLWQGIPDDGIYRTGKRMQRVAKLILIADELGDSAVKSSLIDLLEKTLSDRMRGKTNWELRYDTTWGGIIPVQDDFGSVHYNDHHFHYGYWVYAFAVVAKFDARWLTSVIPGSTFSPKQWIDTLIRDYANPNEDDPYFVKQRYQDTFLGHSWASGLVSLSDGQNQESSSEAVNSYYAIALYASVINDPVLFEWGRKLLANEINSAQTYWQVTPEDKVYDEQFTHDNWVIANVWGSKVETNTHFQDCSKNYRCGLQYTFGIQMLPQTPISDQLYRSNWLRGARDTIHQVVDGQFGAIESSWKWILLKGMNQTLTSEERQRYFLHAKNSSMTDYDDGDSKTQTLYVLSSIG